MTWWDDFVKNGLGDFLGGAANAGVGAYGYNTLMNQLKKDRGEVQNSIEDITTDVQEAGDFTPWSVRSRLGTTRYNPETGELTNALGTTNAIQSDLLGYRANENWGRAHRSQDQREQDVYERIRMMQRPEENRQYDKMNAGLFGSGRGGMESRDYGSSPEQYAFALAQAEARNTASYQAIGQAQQEMQNYAQLADMQFKNQYLPQTLLQEQSRAGMESKQMFDTNRQNMAGLLAQLGLGGTTAETNYSNIQGESLVGLLRMLGAGISGASSSLFPTPT